jgi:hypothetical protein
MQPKVICLMYIVSKETKSIQDSEADTTSSGRNPSSVDIQTLIHRNEPNRPHISSVIKFSKSVETKSPRALIFLAQPANPTSDFFPPNLPEHPPQSVPRPNNRLSSAGEGVFTVSPEESQELFSAFVIFFS